MARYISAVDTAKLVRKALKAAFPGTKFSVRTDQYAGGASIRVKYADGPSLEAVERVAQPFAGATFDGMRDLKEYHTSDLDGEAVRFGANFVFVDRRLSEAALAEAAGSVTWLSPDSFSIRPDNGWGASVQTVDTIVQSAIYRAARGMDFRAAEVL